VHRQPPGSRRVAAAGPKQDADLVRRRVDVLGEKLSVAGLHLGRAADLDVLADAPDQLQPLLLERRDRVGPVGLDRLQDSLGEAQELVVLRDRLGLAADRDDRAGVAGDSGETSPSVVSRPAFLPAAAMPCSRRSRCAASTSPPVSSRARLAAIIPPRSGREAP
jgi:hypothetical protein